MKRVVITAVTGLIPSFEIGQAVRENRPDGRQGHVVDGPTNEGCDYMVEWRHGRRETVDRCDIVPLLERAASVCALHEG